MKNKPTPKAVATATTAAPVKIRDGEIEVRCQFQELLPIGQVRPHPQNPKKHPEAQVSVFADILKYQGIRRPLVISKTSGFLVVGHGQLLALESLGAERVPVEYQVFASPAAELAHLLADNKLAELGVVGDEQLEGLLKQLEREGVDERLAAVLRDLDDEPEEEPQSAIFDLVPAVDEGYNGVLVFTRTGQEWAALSTLLDLQKGVDRRGTVGVMQVVHFKRFLELWKSR